MVYYEYVDFDSDDGFDSNSAPAGRDVEEDHITDQQVRERNAVVHAEIFAALQSRKLTVKRQVQLLQTLLEARQRFPIGNLGYFH